MIKPPSGTACTLFLIPWACKGPGPVLLLVVIWRNVTKQQTHLPELRQQRIHIPVRMPRTIAARLTARLTDPGGTGAEEACAVS